MDTPVTREEWTRLIADMNALRMLVAHDVGHRWGRARVDAWYDSRTRAIEAQTTPAATTAHAIRALDALGERLRLAADASGIS